MSGGEGDARPLSLEDIGRDLREMMQNGESLVAVFAPASRGAARESLFTYAQEKGAGDDTSMPALASRVNQHTPEELRGAAVSEQRRLEEQTETLYCRAHESSLAFLERSAWLEQAESAVGSMQNAIDDVARHIEALNRIIAHSTSPPSLIETSPPDQSSPVSGVAASSSGSAKLERTV